MIAAPSLYRPLTEEAATDLSALLKALAQPRHLRMISLIASGTVRTQAGIGAAMGLPQSSVSLILIRLEGLGLVRPEQVDSKRRVYYVTDLLRSLAAALLPPDGAW